MAKFAVILPAAGRSSRFRDKSYKKPFAPLANKAIWLHSAERFLGRRRRGADDPGDCARGPRPISTSSSPPTSPFWAFEVIDGGAERADSVEAALARVKPEADFICVHDAARPCLTDAWIDDIFAAAEKTGAAIFAIPVAGTLKRVGADHKIEETVPRDSLWEAQTPQVFRRQLLLEAYAKRGGFPATDDAQLVERIGHPVTVVPGSPMNMKITTKEDQRLAEQALKALPKPKLPGPLHPFDDRWR